MNNTDIGWTNLSWNVWSGCSACSPGCKYCYAKTMAERLRGTTAFPNGFDLTYRWQKLDEPLHMRKGRMIFVNSMSDLYWEQVPLDSIKRVFEVMNECHKRGLKHKFQILTKRSRRLLEMASALKWTPNIWQGVSVENQDWTCRLDDLVQVPAAVRFVSVEPLLGPVDLSAWLPELHWVIAGGESGPNYRHMDPGWVRDIRSQCEKYRVPFFMKQHSARRPETCPYIIEEDGSETVYRQYPQQQSPSFIKLERH